MKITIPGRIPSKKNSKVVVCRGKRPMVLPSKAYQEWHTVSSMKLPKPDGQEYNNAHITLFAPDKRKADLTNKVESIMDLLVDNKIIEDDNWFVIENIHIVFGGVDKENPRAVIELS
jgi:Holliday junction resolvase RusA-like endonuclease